jgi:hypothetical protein
MTSIVIIVVVIVVVLGVYRLLRTRGQGLAARRGLSVGADLAAMADRPRVRVREVSSLSPDRVRVVLVPADDGTGEGDTNTPLPDTPLPDTPLPDRPLPDRPLPDRALPDRPLMELIVNLAEDSFGLRILREWQVAQDPLAVVEPPGGQLVRLRSTVDLQHLTLRRTEGVR